MRFNKEVLGATRKLTWFLSMSLSSFGDFEQFESVLNVCDDQVCDTCEKHTWYEGVGRLSALPFARWFGTSVGKTKQKCDKVKQITRYLSKNKTRVCEMV